MLRNANPDSTDLRTAPVRRPRFVLPVAGLAAVALLGGGLAWYQLEVKADRAPDFDIGGEFQTGLPVAGNDGRPFPYGDAGATTSTVAGAGASSTTLDPNGTTVPGTGGTAPGPGAGPTSPAPGGDGGGATPPPAAGPTGPSVEELLAAPSPRPPAVGTYTYAVAGNESATGFGSRSLPATASLVVHGDPSAPEGLVHDLRLSGQHEERAIVSYGADGIAYTFEAGSITFGPGTQTSQGRYDPPMVQVPWPLADGASASAASAARDGAGNVSRTEQWTTTVVGREVLDVLGQPRETWVVDIQRRTPPGSAEEVDRFRRYWYDPVLGTWVKWTERFHGARQVLLTFTYDAEYTATLTGFAPG